MSFKLQLQLLNKGARRVSSFAHLGLFAGFTAVFTLVLLLYAGAGYIQTNLIGELPDQEMRVGIRMKDMAMLRIPDPDAKQTFAEEDLNALSAIGGVNAVFPIRYANQPAELNVNMLGRTIRTDIVIQGIDPEWISGDLPGFDFGGGDQPFQVIVNTQLLAIYNNGYALSQGFPQLSEDALKIPVLTLLYGREPRFTTGTMPLKIDARVGGMSPRVALGLAVPGEILNDWHQQLNVEPAPVTEAVLNLSKGSNLDSIREAVAALGFDPEPANPLALAIQRLQTAGLSVGIALMIAVALFGSLYLGQTLNLVFMVKRRDYAVCRAMGMSRTRLRQLLLTENLTLISADLIAGLIAGLLAAHLLTSGLINAWLTKWLGTQMQIILPWGAISLIAVGVLAVALLTIMPRIWRLTATPPGSMLD